MSQRKHEKCGGRDMSKKLGELIKKARTDAGLTQEQLAKKVDGVSASDISKAERGEKELTQAALKQIAKATGVTQASLLQAAKGKGKTGTAKKPAAASSSMKLTASEKKLVELYRKADDKTKKAAMDILKKKKDGSDEMISSLMGTAAEVIELLSKK